MTKAFKIGIFDREEEFISSLRSLSEEEIEIFDVYTPYPVHEVFEILKRKSRLPTVAYFIGLFAIIASLGFLYYAAVIDWPIVYGGKPFNSFPSFIVITLVLTIFTVTIGSLGVFSARSKLYPGRDNTIFDHRATDDKFVIVMDADILDDSKADKAIAIMKEWGAIEIIDRKYDNVKV